MTSRRFDQVALFSMINWPCFQLSKCRQDGQSGPLFGDQMALFSFDKNSEVEKAGHSGWADSFSLSLLLSAIGLITWHKFNSETRCDYR